MARPGPPTAAGSGPDLRHWVTVLQVDSRRGRARGLHPAPDRPSEQVQGGGQRHEPVLGDLLGLRDDGGEDGVIERAAVEEEPYPARPAWPGPAKVDAGQPRAPHVDAALLPYLAPARVPRRLTVGFHHPAGYGPPGLVGRLQDEEPASVVEDQRSGGRGDGREGRRIAGRKTACCHKSHATSGRPSRDGAKTQNH